MPTTGGGQDLYSPWVGLVYVFNLIVGTGALTLPTVFAGAGWLLSLILVMTLAFFGFVTVTFIIESMACANASIKWRKVQSYKVDGESETLIESGSDKDNLTEETAIINRSRQRYYTLNHKVELGEMATLYFTKTGRLLFFVSLCVYLYGDLAIYAAAISKTVTDLICNSSNNASTENFEIACWDGSAWHKMEVYRVLVSLLAILVGPFSYFNIQKTKYLQMFTSTFRWCAFTIMILIAITHLFEYGQQGFPPVAKFTGVPALLGASVYSFMCHHSLPGLIAPFADKKYVVRQLAFDYILICSFYVMLALTGSFAFGKLFDLYTLNFVPTSLNKSGVIMNVVEYFLGLFPLFTLSTSFPIIAITLQNNLKALFLDVNALDSYNFVLRRLTFPTCAIIPPILVALLTHNLSSLVEFTGSFAGVAIQYVVPAFLVWAARNNCRPALGSAFNQYASPFKGTFWIVFVLCWALMCVVLVTVNLVSGEI